jgi:hypothetical protein
MIKKNNTSTVYIEVKTCLFKVKWEKYKDPRVIRKIIKSSKTQLQGLI